MSSYDVKIPAFIIHLERAKSRRTQVDRLAKNLLETQIINQVNILPAIDAHKLSNSEVSASYVQHLVKPYYPFSLKLSEIACFLSHRQAWQKIVDQELDAALITEDDMQPNDIFSQNLQLARQYIKKHGFIRFPHYDCETGATVANLKNSNLIRPHRLGLGMVAYMISYDAAKQLLAFTTQFDRPVDVILQMFWLTKIRPLALAPGGVAEISAQIGGSTLAQSQNLRHKLHREIMRPIYRGKIYFLSRLKG